MDASHSRRGSWRRRAAVGTAVLGGAALLAACSTSSSSSTTTTGAGVTATTTTGGSDAAARLDALAGNVRSAQKATFQAVYTSSSGGSTSTVTLAQSPPNSCSVPPTRRARPPR